MSSVAFYRSLGLLGRAFLVAVVIALPSIVGMVGGNGYSPAVFNDWDEGLYLKHCLDTCQISVFQFLENMRQDGYPIPHKISEYPICVLASAVGFNSATLGILLDLVCGFLAYLAAASFFSVMSNSKQAEAASLVSLLFPWIAALSVFVPIPVGHPNLVSIPHEFFPSLPIQRAVYTQISIPVSFWALSLVGKSTHSLRLVPLVWAGTLSAALLYLYFFAWLYVGLLAALVVACEPVIIKTDLIATIKRLFIYSIVLGTASLPGLALLFKDGKVYTPGPSQSGLTIAPVPYGDYWYLSLVVVIGIILVGLFLVRQVRSQAASRRTFLSLLVLLTLIAELILTNLQPLIGKWITPYHFTLFYLHPLLSGLMLLVLFDLLKSAAAQRRLFQLIAGMTGLFAVLITFRTHSALTRFADTAELIEAVSKYTEPDTSFAVFPYSSDANDSRLISYMIAPYWVAALASRENFSDFMGYSPLRIPFIKKEMYLGLIYKGEPALLGNCSIKVPEFPGDIISGASFFLQHSRLVDCEMAAAVLSIIQACDLISQFKIDYLVHQASQARLPKVTKEATTLLWQNDQYSLYRFDSDAFGDKHCAR